MGRQRKKDLLLDTAESLFERQGFIATGVNQIAAEAGTAPMTLYNNFSGKEALIEALLIRRSERFLTLLEERAEASLKKLGAVENTLPGAIIADQAGEKSSSGQDSSIFAGSLGPIGAIFDALDDWVLCEALKPSGFKGCLFLKAVNEFQDPSSQGRALAIDHKKQITALFEKYLKKAGYSIKTQEMALSLQLLLDGALTQAHLLNDQASVKRAKKIAAEMLGAAATLRTA